MLEILAKIVDDGLVTNGVETFRLHSGVRKTDGEFIQRIISRIAPKTYLEVGFAYGISTLYAGEALQKTEQPYVHYIIDPKQSAGWHGVGIYNMKKSNLWDNVKFYEERSEYILPKLAESGLKIDMAFIDGWHTFDHTLLDFFYCNRMLNIGGVIILDDADWRSVSKVLKYVSQYPCYRPYGMTKTPVLRALIEAAKRGHPPNFKPKCVAIKKVAEDERNWLWYRRF